MNAVWIALIAVFAALIPVFIFAANQSQKKKAARADGDGGYVHADTGHSGKSSHHNDASDSGDSGGGDGGGGGD